MSAVDEPVTTGTRRRELATWQWVLVAIVGTFALALAVYSAAASYESVFHLALKSGVPLPRLNPIGIDGGLAAIILFDIVLTLIWEPIGWLRFMARLFAAGTIAANVLAGWPSGPGVALRVAAPTLLILIVEGIRVLLLRRNEEHLDSIPVIRWALAPAPTFAIWRRMRLWSIASYPEALAMDARRRRAIRKLTAHYAGRNWRKAAPDDLAWKLRQGLFMEEALAEVEELTVPKRELQGPGSPQNKRRTSTRNKARSSGQKRPAISPPSEAAASPPEPDAASPLNGETGSASDAGSPELAPEDMDTEAQALKILTDKPGISGSELGRRLGKTERYGCILKNKLVGAATGPETRSES